MLTLVTAHHTGTHTANAIFSRYYHQHHLEQDRLGDVGITKPPYWFGHSETANMGLISRRIEETGLLVLTMRDPHEVPKSWIKRGKEMGKGFREMWKNLFALQKAHNGLWLPVDTPDRDERLRAISDRLGHEIVADWKPKNATESRFEYHRGMTYEDALEYLAQFPFGQFGYKEIDVPAAKKKAARKKAAQKAKIDAMPKFIFSGDPVSDPPCDPPSITVMGYTFKLNGKPVPVSDDVAANFRNNSHFTEK